MSVITETAFRFLGRVISLPAPVLSQAVSRRSDLLIQALSKVSRPDWVIGHNPGALWPAYIAGKKFVCKTGFDVEDYHPGEGNNHYLQQLSKQLLREVLPSMNYVSFAAPLIQQAVERDFDMAPPNWFTLMNYFPALEFTAPPAINEGPVKMVWFSQNVSYGRGLELVLPAVKKMTGIVELHLIGNMDETFYQQELKSVPNIIIHSPMSQKGLHQKLVNFDIGLALDIPVDINRNIALTNKILAYLQSGLFVLATNTDAQHDLLTGLPGHGYCFDLKENSSTAFIERVVAEINSIRGQRLERYNSFNNQNWETASAALSGRWIEG